MVSSGKRNLGASLWKSGQFQSTFGVLYVFSITLGISYVRDKGKCMSLEPVYETNSKF